MTSFLDGGSQFTRIICRSTSLSMVPSHRYSMYQPWEEANEDFFLATPKDNAQRCLLQQQELWVSHARKTHPTGLIGFLCNRNINPRAWQGYTILAHWLLKSTCWIPRNNLEYCYSVTRELRSKVKVLTFSGNKWKATQVGLSSTFVWLR